MSSEGKKSGSDVIRISAYILHHQTLIIERCHNNFGKNMWAIKTDYFDMKLVVSMIYCFLGIVAATNADFRE
jgi:hypothetical protein